MATTGSPPPWDPSQDIPVMRKQMELQGPMKTITDHEHTYNNYNLVLQTQNCKAGVLASQDSSFRPGQRCIIYMSKDSLKPLKKGENKLSQKPVGVSTTACLDHFHHQIPRSFSLLQLSWLQHHSGLQYMKYHQIPGIQF